MEPTDLMTRILERRGFITEESKHRFINPDYKDLHDPFELRDMDKAVERVVAAHRNHEKVVIYGDYDIDGLSATALLLDAFGFMGMEVSAYIPDRFEEGYGINQKALQQIMAEGASLVITVDCGSVSHEPLAWAAGNGLDVIVTDHHVVGETLPDAVAVINPKRKDSRYPFNDLAGVGVAFKLVQALAREGVISEAREKWLLDLVALGTVCDVVDLLGENRILVTYGLKVFSRTSRTGLRALMSVAGIRRDTIDTYDFGFILGPRLNAAGRLEHAKLALKLLTTKSTKEALKLAVELDVLNTRRRRQQDEILKEALSILPKFEDDPVLVLSGAKWNHGIAGIVAAKLTDRFAKPSIVLQEMGKESKGSARSLSGYNIVEALSEAKDILIKYGGHDMAAGCSLRTENIPKLRRLLNQNFKKNVRGRLQTEPEPDLAIEDLSLLGWDTYKLLQKLAPFGYGNPKPLLHIPKVKIKDCKLVGADKRHVKLRLDDGMSVLDAIAFGQSESLNRLDGEAGIFFELSENEFNRRVSLQAKVARMEPCRT